MKEKLTAVILAAGSGERFGSKLPKAFIKISGKPMFWYSTYAFNSLEAVDNIYVVVSPEKLEFVKKTQLKYLKNILKFKGFITGGKSRQDSVYNALKIISVEDGIEYVAIHDAARPFIKPNVIFDIFKEAVKVGGAAPGISVVDTIKQVNENDFISKHLKREDIVAIQTPQIFKFDKISKAYQIARKKNLCFTDDTEVFTLVDKKIMVVSGDNDLIKMTYKDDIKIAKEIIKRNKKIWK
jgi:2-C-methyl-D-erythritol 4-phosphate cytidylyltransferase